MTAASLEQDVRYLEAVPDPIFILPCRNSVIRIFPSEHDIFLTSRGGTIHGRAGEPRLFALTSSALGSSCSTKETLKRKKGALTNQLEILYACEEERDRLLHWKLTRKGRPFSHHSRRVQQGSSQRPIAGTVAKIPIAGPSC